MRRGIGLFLIGLGVAFIVLAPMLKYYAVPRLAGETVAGLPPVTGRMTVDQFGYLPDGEKVAVIRDPQTGFDASATFTPGSSYALVNAASGDATIESITAGSGRSSADSPAPARTSAVSRAKTSDWWRAS